MFNNIGTKIKTVAKISCGIGIFISVIVGVILLLSVGFLEGLLTILVGCLLGWLSSICLYGFGELIDKVTEIADYFSDKRAQESIERFNDKDNFQSSPVSRFLNYEKIDE